MEIIFYRKGYANNSSSSHALVFLDDKTKIETQDRDVANGFQWNSFIASSRESKLKYMLSSISSWFYRAYQGRYSVYDETGEGQFITAEMIRGFEASLFSAYIKKYHLDYFFNSICKNNNLIEEIVSSISNNNYDLFCVDHQSLLRLPINRTGKNIHIGFMKSLFSEIIENNYVFLGGNDNDEESRAINNPVYDRRINNKNHIIEFVNFIKDAPCDILCVYDKKCDHFVLSKMNGPIMMVKFDRNFES